MDGINTTKANSISKKYLLTTAFISLFFSVLSIGFATFIFKDYGLGLFVATPFFNGALFSFLISRKYKKKIFYHIKVGLLSPLAVLIVLLIFKMEGAICLIMAS